MTHARAHLAGLPMAILTVTTVAIFGLAIFGLTVSGLTVPGLGVARAEAACPARLHVGFSDTLASIARRCGINVEALRAINPGLAADTLRPGMVIAIPRPALPSPQQPVGRPSVRIAPSLMPPATGISPPLALPAPSPTLQHPQVPPGFDNRPQHMRPRAPHAPFPPFPHQWN